MHQPLKHVCIVVPTKSGASSGTQRCLEHCETLGAVVCALEGCSDVALARSLVIMHALTAPGFAREVFLLVDDDMCFSPADAELICERAQVAGKAVSAVYATSSRNVAGLKRADGLWLTGLGFLAVPSDLLRSVYEKAPEVEGINGMRFRAVCQSGIHPGRPGFWTSEDYWFCQDLGGVLLAPIAVGHYKQVPIRPDAESMRVLFEHPKEFES